jgi:uncharacterized protein (TIGR00251 family)
MARISVRLTPRAGRDAIDGWHAMPGASDVLRVRVAAAPTDGAANDALVRLLAKALAVPAAAVRIASGARSRTKIIDIDGVSDADLHARIDAKIARSEARGR